MGRRSAIEKHNLGPLIKALQGEGVTSVRRLAEEVSRRVPGVSVSKDAVARWLKGETGSVARSQRQAHPNGQPTPPPDLRVGAPPVELAAGEDLEERIIKALMALGECSDVPVSDRIRALEHAGYFAHLRRTGDPP